MDKKTIEAKIAEYSKQLENAKLQAILLDGAVQALESLLPEFDKEEE